MYRLCGFIIFSFCIFVQATTEEIKCDKKYIDEANIVYENCTRDLVDPICFFIIEGSDVKHLCKGFLKRYVRHIYINDVGLEYIEPGTFQELDNPYRPNTFPHLVSLRRNNLKIIKNEDFSNIDTIHHLDLAYNKIETIEPEAFNNMSSLELLQLDNNKLKEWNPDWTNNCARLHSVYLSTNLIAYLPEHTLKNLNTNFSTTYSINVPHFSARNNRISEIHPKAFANQNNFKWILLNNNNLTSLPDELFAHFSEVHYFSIADNPIECFSDAMLQTWKKIHRVNLSTHKLSPECKEKLEAFRKNASLLGKPEIIVSYVPRRFS